MYSGFDVFTTGKRHFIVTTLYMAVYQNEEPHLIHCEDCNITSYHPEDVRQRYCARCDQFLDAKLLQQHIKESLPLRMVQ